ELEARGLIAEQEREGTTHVGFTHPLLAVAAARHVGLARRHRIAAALAASTTARVDVARRARWHLLSGSPCDPALLLAGARSVLLAQRALAAALAERALDAPAPEGRVDAALVLADARAEAGDVAGATAAIERARRATASEADRVAV